MFTGTKVSKIHVHISYFAYFYNLSHYRLACGQTHIVPNVTGTIVMPIDFCCMTSMCISSELHVNYLVASSCCTVTTKCVMSVRVHSTTQIEFKKLFKFKATNKHA